jgi:hypothetical protein
MLPAAAGFLAVEASGLGCFVGDLAGAGVEGASEGSESSARRWSTVVRVTGSMGWLEPAS